MALILLPPFFCQSGLGKSQNLRTRGLASKGFEGHFRHGNGHLNVSKIISAMEVGLKRLRRSFPPWKLASIEIYGRFRHGSGHLSRFMVVSAMEVGIYRDLWPFPPWKLASIGIEGHFHYGNGHLKSVLGVSARQNESELFPLSI